MLAEEIGTLSASVTFPLLPSRRASPPFDQYRIMLLADRGGVNNLSRVVTWRGDSPPGIAATLQRDRSRSKGQHVTIRLNVCNLDLQLNSERVTESSKLLTGFTQYTQFNTISRSWCKIKGLIMLRHEMCHNWWTVNVGIVKLVLLPTLTASNCTVKR